jgi:hypothetical protein
MKKIIVEEQRNVLQLVQSVVEVPDNFNTENLEKQYRDHKSEFCKLLGVTSYEIIDEDLISITLQSFVIDYH